MFTTSNSRNVTPSFLLRKLDFFAFFLGISSAINFVIGVVLIPIEFISILYMTFSLNRLSRLQEVGLQRFIRLLIFSGIILAISQLFVDLYMGASKLETIKSIAQIVTLVALIFTGITWLSQKNIRLVSFLLGYVLSSTLTFLFFSNEYIKIDSWKFLFGSSITIATLTILGFVRIPQLLKLGVIASLSLIHFALGARSLALFSILTTVSLLTPSKTFAKKGGFFLSFLSILLLSILTENVYQDLALGGKLGVAQQEKARQQYESGALILFARSELLYELGAIKQSPFVGKGSNPKLAESLLFDVTREQERFGLHVKETAAYSTYLKSGSIPLHSMIFSSWVESGLIGAFFWLIILYFFIRNFRVVVSSQSALKLLSTYFLFSALWSLFFSPLGAGSRLFIALAVTCIARLIITESEIQKK